MRIEKKEKKLYDNEADGLSTMGVNLSNPDVWCLCSYVMDRVNQTSRFIQTT